MVWNHGAIIRELVCHLAEHGKISYGEWREKFGEYSDAMLDGQVSKSDTTTPPSTGEPQICQCGTPLKNEWVTVAGKHYGVDCGCANFTKA